MSVYQSACWRGVRERRASVLSSPFSSSLEREMGGRAEAGCWEPLQQNSLCLIDDFLPSLHPSSLASPLTLFPCRLSSQSPSFPDSPFHLTPSLLLSLPPFLLAFPASWDSDVLHKELKSRADLVKVGETQACCRILVFTACLAINLSALRTITSLMFLLFN